MSALNKALAAAKAAYKEEKERQSGNFLLFTDTHTTAYRTIDELVEAVKHVSGGFRCSYQPPAVDVGDKVARILEKQTKAEKKAYLKALKHAPF